MHKRPPPDERYKKLSHEIGVLVRAHMAHAHDGVLEEIVDVLCEHLAGTLVSGSSHEADDVRGFEYATGRLGAYIAAIRTALKKRRLA